MEEKTEMLELMKRIEKANRRQTVLCILLCVCALVTAICCIVTFGTVNQLLAQVGEIIPQISQAIPKVTDVISQMQTVLGNLETTTNQLAAMDLTGMVADVDERAFFSSLRRPAKGRCVSISNISPKAFTATTAPTIKSPYCSA